MIYYSTTNAQLTADFRSATIEGLAPDGGLYFPRHLPSLPSSFVQELKKYSPEEIAWEVMHPFVADTIPSRELKEILAQTIDFPFPLKALDERISVLELFHGPTLAFKDVGARFMSRCLGYFVRNSGRETTVLVATSGDTGGAVASGFLHVPGIRVVILYPKGKVSPIQELQLTTPGNNIHAIAVTGNFDDCQRMVKEAFVDKALNQKLKLTSANSINVARWLPQQLYFFLGYQQWKEKDGLPVISVPSGNLGNLCAGLLSFLRGLPVQRFIAACNANDVLSSFLATGVYNPHKAVPTSSNAMDVGDPSNFARMLHLFLDRPGDLKSVLRSASFDDAAVKEAISKVSNDHGYTLDPHGAVGYLALEEALLADQYGKGFFLETAHPIKFPSIVEEATGLPLPYPHHIKSLLEAEGHSIEMSPDYHELRAYLEDSV